MQTKKKSYKKSKAKPYKKSKAKPYKKKVFAVAAKPEFYKVQLEVAHQKGDGTTEYTYVDHPSRVDVAEEIARQMVEDLKMIGCGGRLILLDGTPEVQIVLTWGSVERTAAAEKIETAALDGAGQK